jgi:hypothetical protein
MNPNEPLGLPRGSIRAILALLVTAGTLGYFLIHTTFPAEMIAVQSVVLTYYFLSRDREDGDNPAVWIEPEPAAPYIPGDDQDL